MPVYRNGKGDYLISAHQHVSSFSVFVLATAGLSLFSYKPQKGFVSVQRTETSQRCCTAARADVYRACWYTSAPKEKKRAETPTDRLIEKINEMEEKREARHNRHMHLLEHLVVAYEKKCE